jgi:hypothetical protein
MLDRLSFAAILLQTREHLFSLVPPSKSTLIAEAGHLSNDAQLLHGCFNGPVGQ